MLAKKSISNALCITKISQIFVLGDSMLIKKNVCPLNMPSVFRLKEQVRLDLSTHQNNREEVQVMVNQIYEIKSRSQTIHTFYFLCGVYMSQY